MVNNNNVNIDNKYLHNNKSRLRWKRLKIRIMPMERKIQIYEIILGVMTIVEGDLHSHRLGYEIKLQLC